MAFSALRIGALILPVMLAACSGGAGQAAATATLLPTPISTAGLPLAPSAPVLDARDTQAPRSEDLLTLAKQARVCGKDSFVSTAAAVKGRIFVGCRGGGAVLVVDRHMRVLQSLPIWMYSVDIITAAGAHAIAVSGYSDGAAMQNQLSILDSTTLKTIVKHRMSDSTLLGVIGDRAYIDDWCCFGRPDAYAPATIYWISLKDGSESKHVDLAPDQQSHPGNLAPLGQGEHNYMQGRYFYVVVTDDNKNSMTYRYDVLHLDRGPVRMRSSPSLAS